MPARRILPAALLALTACQSQPDLSTLRDRPEDFTIAATVYNSRSGLDVPRALRPARYILEADSVLRWSPGASHRGLPPPLHSLRPSESAEVWRLARDSGLLEPDSVYRVQGPIEIDAATVEGPIAVFEIAFGGAQTASKVLLSRSSDEAVLAERLIDRLAELAFVRE